MGKDKKIKQSRLLKVAGFFYFDIAGLEQNLKEGSFIRKRSFVNL